MMDDALLEPVKAYNSIYKEAVNAEAGRYFDEIVTKSNIDIEANRKTISDIKKKEKEYLNAKKKLASLKAGRGWLIFLTVFFFILAIICAFCFATPDVVPLYASIPICVLGIGLGIFMIVIIVKNFNPKIKDADNYVKKLQDELGELINTAKAQLAPLNALYDWNMPAQVIENVIPILDFDKVFDGNKYYKLCDDYGLNKLVDPNMSVVFALSGNILGNPFVFQTQKVHSIYQKEYTGSITISWTETYYDSEGRAHTRHRTQTLTATTYHPAPRYTKGISLIYGNHAAPDLSFSRTPTNIADKDDKQLRKYVEKHQGDLYKRAEKSLKNGDSQPFTPLANTEFELLFGALDRNHNVQYRLLFTPLAQTNIKNLLRSKDGFGDDFHYTKMKRINIVASEHMQNVDLSGNPSIFIDYNYDQARQKFIDWTNDFFKNIYFEFAPLLSIPLYQQMKSLDYIYGEDAPSNYSTYEHEIFANTFPDKVMLHPDSITEGIYKTRIISKHGKSDKFRVTAFSYKGEERVDYVTKMGGDGNLHTIPVYWTEYIPLYQDNDIELKDVKSTRHNFYDKLNNSKLGDFIDRKATDGWYSFQRGMLALLASSSHFNSKDDETLDSIFSEKDE